MKLQNPHGSTCRCRNVNMACRLPFPAKVCRIKRFVNEEGGEGILKVRNLQSICGLGTATKDLSLYFVLSFGTFSLIMRNR